MLFARWRSNVGIAAAIERELAAVRDAGSESTALSSRSRSWLTTSTVCGIAREIILQPQRAFEIEIVGRLVEQQQIGLGEQHAGERHAHAPAAGKFRSTGALCVGGRKSRGPARIDAARAGAACASISTSRVWISAMRCGSCAVSASASSAARSRIGGQHHLEQALRPVRRFLRQPADAASAADLDIAVLGRDLAGDHLEQRGLAGAVAPDQPDAGAGRDAGRGISSSARPAMRTVRSSMMSMARAFWPTARCDATPSIPGLSRSCAGRLARSGAGR